MSVGAEMHGQDEQQLRRSRLWLRARNVRHSSRVISAIVADGQIVARVSAVHLLALRRNSAAVTGLSIHLGQTLSPSTFTADALLQQQQQQHNYAVILNVRMIKSVADHSPGEEQNRTSLFA